MFVIRTISLKSICQDKGNYFKQGKITSQYQSIGATMGSLSRRHTFESN